MRQPVFVGPYHEIYGVVTQARMPLKFPDGSFFGWLALEWEPEQWIASQAQARLQAFTIVALGLGLGMLGMAQRLKGRAAEAARQADRTKTEFLARVSHELRTPIQSVLGYGELLENAVQGEEAKSRLRALRQQGVLMTRLVNDLLDLAALQTGHFRFSAQPTRVAELIKQTVESLRPRAEAKGLRLRTEFAVAGDRWFEADGERVRQVVINLTVNAIKFTDQGEVAVSLAEETPGTLVLRVSDSGPGISRENAARLFNPFIRLEETMAKEGSGLGLALTAALCEGMGGNVALEEQRVGACFVARFKFNEAAAKEEETAQPGHWLSGRRILIVDDNTLIRDLFHTHLSDLGAHCRVAANGPEALELAAKYAFDAVVLDYALPGLDGVAVARALREGKRSSACRIVGVSAHAREEERRRAMEAGMDVFLTKPVGLRALAVALGGPGESEPPVRPGLAGLTERLRAQFRAEAPLIEAALVAAMTERDWAAVRAKTHYLKNSADVLGLDELSAACREVENAFHAGDPADPVATAAACLKQLHRWSQPPFAPSAQFNTHQPIRP